MNFPKNAYASKVAEANPQWVRDIKRSDGVIFVSPEYNHGYSGHLKIMVDAIHKHFTHKACGLVGVSSGPWGGVRGVQALVPLVRELGLAVTFSDLMFPFVREAFDARGNPKDDKSPERVQGFVDELVWMAASLRWGRSHL